MDTKYVRYVADQWIQQLIENSLKVLIVSIFPVRNYF